MKMYKLQMRTFTGGLPWEYDFDMASDDMAIEYTKRIITADGALPAQCMSVNLWGVSDKAHLVGEYHEAHLIGEYRVETKREVKVVTRKGR